MVLITGLVPNGLPHSSVGKEAAFNVGDLGLIPGLGRSPREEKAYPFQYSRMENSTYCKSQTGLSDFHTFTLAPNNHCVTFPRSFKTCWVQSSYAK